MIMFDKLDSGELIFGPILHILLPLDSSESLIVRNRLIISWNKNTNANEIAMNMEKLFDLIWNI